MTEYRHWPRDPRYLAGDDGSIIGVRGRVLKPNLGKRDGRYNVGVSRVGGGTRTVSVQSLVAEAWHGLRPAGMEVAHNNGQKTDNRPSNLRWATPKENAADKFLHGTQPLGAAHYRATFCEAQILEIRAAYTQGSESQTDLARRFGVTSGAISALVRGRTWGNVNDGIVHEKFNRVPVGEKHGRSRATEDTVRAIRAAAAQGVTQREIARRFGMSLAGVNHIILRHVWKHVA